MNEFDETEEDFDDGRPHPMHKLYKIIRPIFLLGCLIVTVLIFFRMCSQNKIPSEIEALSVNDDLKQAFNEKGENLSIIYQEYDIYSVEPERLDSEGIKIQNAGRAYFAVPEALFIKDADQVQLVLRYNISTLKYLSMDYAELCPEIPDRSENVFDITLVKVTDLTPETADDNDDMRFLKEERFTYSDMKTAESSRHNFSRITFEDFELDGAIRVYLCIYYKGAVDYGNDPYATVTIYKNSLHDTTYKLTKNDKIALESAVK